MHCLNFDTSGVNGPYLKNLERIWAMFGALILCIYDTIEKRNKEKTCLTSLFLKSQYRSQRPYFNNLETKSPWDLPNRIKMISSWYFKSAILLKLVKYAQNYP